jgi:Ca2+-transporting ATPase
MNNFHAKTIAEVVGGLGIDPMLGLTDAEHKERIRRYGRNAIKTENKYKLPKIIYSQLTNPLALILIAAGTASFLLGELSNAFVILIAVIINTGIGAYQEGHADTALEKLRTSVRKHVIVIRDGHEMLVDIESLVPGDITITRAGDNIGADARVIESKGLAVNEAVLTGEWLAAEKDPAPLDPKTHFAERKNMVFMGTVATEGWGRAIVVATGANAEFYKIGELLRGAAQETPFQKGVRHLAKMIGMIAVIAAVAVFILGALRGEDPMQMFLTAVAVAVAAVPEGLPIATTVILALGMGKILSRGGLVKNLVAAETLGTTSIILTDKTGTLTKAEMQVSNIIVPEEIIGKAIVESVIMAAKLKTLETAILSADAFIENPDAELKDWIVRGKPTERAIFQAGITSGLHPHKIREQNKRLDFFPFDAERRVAASLNQVGDATQISVAGAPEKVLSFSSHFESGGKRIKLTPALLAELTAAYEIAVRGGSRVVGVAYRRNGWTDLTKDREIFTELIFVGFIAFHDPLRHDVPHAISEARAAGVRTIMLTGDHLSTATAIARAAGIIDDNNTQIIDGAELEAMDDATLDERLASISGYARVLPHQKMRIVTAWQRRGEIVAMTGDGVNDAPALKRADIGIALGSGTDVAKEAADLVLTNDSFSVIVAAIEEGRVIMDNLRKMITFLLATGFTEIFLIGSALTLGLAIPILPAHILWANLIEEGFMNFAFAFEPKEGDVMKRGPRKGSGRMRSHVLTSEMIRIVFSIGVITNAFLFGLYLFLLGTDRSIEEIRSVMFAGLAIDAIFFVYAVKSLRRPIWRMNPFSNRYLVLASLVSIALLLLAFLWPTLRHILSLQTIDISEITAIVILGFLDLAVIEAAKYFFIWRGEKREVVLKNT